MVPCCGECVCGLVCANRVIPVCGLVYANRVLPVCGAYVWCFCILNLRLLCTIVQPRYNAMTKTMKLDRVKGGPKPVLAYLFG